MSKTDRPPVHARWAQLRFSVVGPLLASPPQRGQLYGELQRLAEKDWIHPVTGEPTRFGVSTIERWYHRARRAGTDPVGALRPKPRADQGRQSAIGNILAEFLIRQHSEHPTWSYRLHHDNLEVLVEEEQLPKPLPSYSTIRRDCLDHVIVFNARHLRRVLDEYVAYYNESRTHLGIEKDCPEPRLIEDPETGPSPRCRFSVDCITATRGGLPESDRSKSDWRCCERGAPICPASTLAGDHTPRSFNPRVNS